jgi:IclR family pca regulon transcriptional regulator
VACQAQHVTGPEDHNSGRLYPSADRPHAELDKDLEAVAKQGWALSDGELAPGLRSVAVPVPDGSGKASVAMNIAVYSAETSIPRLINEYLPMLQRTADDISEEWALVQSLPQSEVPSPGYPFAG